MSEVKEEDPVSQSTLVEPHGGLLVDRTVPEAAEPALRDRARGLPALTLDAREAADLELIATGAASPLTGFLGRDDYRSVIESLRLADGTVWPLPLTLAVDDAALKTIKRGSAVALHGAGQRLLALLEVSDVFERNPLEEARLVYGTEDEAHPGVAYLLARPRRLLGGRITALAPAADLPFARYRFTPRALRAEIVRRGWRRVAGFQTRNPIHRAHEHLTKLALEVTDGLVIHPLVGETKGDDVPADVRFHAYETLVERYYPPQRTLLAAFPAAMRYAGPREALFHVLVRKNYGISHLIVGRDHAGVGKYYGPFDAHAILDRFTEGELGVRPIRLDVAFFCRACGQLASTRTCPHGAESRLELSGTRVRELLRAGAALPAEFTRPEVADVLRSHLAVPAPAVDSAPAAAATPADAPPLLPLFLKLEGRRVLVVGGGPVATSKVDPLLRAGAQVTVVAPQVTPELAAKGVAVALRPFDPSDLDGAWLVVAAAPAEVNRAVAAAADRRHVFVVAVDDVASGTAYAAAVVRKGGVTAALSTEGRAPGLAGLLREALEELLPEDLGRWTEEAHRQRVRWKADGVPLGARRGLLLDALNGLYAAREVRS
jgi:sulfate adenylyltransferase